MIRISTSAPEIANPAMGKADLGIAGTEPHGLLLGRDEFLDQPGHELTPAKVAYAGHSCG